MDQANTKTDFLNLQLGISANPAISFLKPAPVSGAVPTFTLNQQGNGFDIQLEAAIQYDFLSGVMKGYLEGKRFDIAEGFIKQYVIVRDCKIYPGMQNNLIVEVAFTGSHNGTVYFTGVPVYNETEKKIDINGFDYDIKTKSFLLKTATWLFDKRIVSEIKKYTSIDLSSYYDTATAAITEWLNKEWTKGIKGYGKVNEIQLTSMNPLPEHLLIRSNCRGQLSITVSEIDLSFGKNL